MARNIEDIEKELMALPIETRKRIAHDLISSLDKGDEELSQEEWEAAWRDEIQRRVEDVQAGRVELRDADEVIAELKAKYNVK